MAKPLPWYYAVNDRPVKFVETPGGGMDVLVFDYLTSAFVRDISYLSRVSEVGIGKDVDQFDEAGFDTLVAQMRRYSSQRRQAMALQWAPTGDGEFAFQTTVDGHDFLIRVNDFPAEPLYTLLIDGTEVEDLDDWPAAWIKAPKAEPTTT